MHENWIKNQISFIIKQCRKTWKFPERNFITLKSAMLFERTLIESLHVSFMKMHRFPLWKTRKTLSFLSLFTLLLSSLSFHCNDSYNFSSFVNASVELSFPFADGNKTRENPKLHHYFCITFEVYFLLALLVERDCQKITTALVCKLCFNEGWAVKPEKLPLLVLRFRKVLIINFVPFITNEACNCNIWQITGFPIKAQLRFILSKKKVFF